MSYILAEDRSLMEPGPWTLDYWPADPVGIMYSLLCGCCCGCCWWWYQNSDPHDGLGSILLSPLPSLRFICICVVYVHLHLCACVCVVQAYGDLKLIPFVFLYDYCIY